MGTVSAPDELPNQLPKKWVVLAGPAEEPTWAALTCPCREGHRILVNLDSRRFPYWLIESNQPLTIEPSLDIVNSNRRCHFFVRNGRIQWIDND